MDGSGSRSLIPLQYPTFASPATTLKYRTVTPALGGDPLPSPGVNRQPVTRHRARTTVRCPRHGRRAPVGQRAQDRRCCRSAYLSSVGQYENRSPSSQVRLLTGPGEHEPTIAVTGCGPAALLKVALLNAAFRSKVMAERKEVCAARTVGKLRSTLGYPNVQQYASCTSLDCTEARKDVPSGDR